MYDRDKGEEEGDGQQTKGREVKWERDTREDRDRRGGDARGEEAQRGGTVDQDDHELDAIKADHTNSDVHALIG